MLKKLSIAMLLISIFFVVIFPPHNGYAYPSTVTILEKKDIVKLSDAALTDAYLDTIIEIEANNVMHLTGGFSPREYQEYKSLLRYRYELRAELQRRQLDIPNLKDDQ